MIPIELYKFKLSTTAIILTLKYFSKFNVRIISDISSSGSKVVLCTPTVIGENTGDFELGNKFKDVQTMDKMNRDLDLFSEVVEKLSSEYSTELLDLRKIFMDYISTNNPNNNSSGILTYDGVHLNKQGNTLIANEMLKFFN